MSWRYYWWSRRWFRFGFCRICRKWGFYIMRSESAHEHCWLEEK